MSASREIEPRHWTDRTPKRRRFYGQRIKAGPDKGKFISLMDQMRASIVAAAEKRGEPFPRPVHQGDK